MTEQMLRDPEIEPTDVVLQVALVDSFVVFERLRKTLTRGDKPVTLEWRYYNDGKAWLCKVRRGAKTIAWLSVWGGFFKLAFNFTAKNSGGIADLGIAKKIVDDFTNTRSIGRLLPLIIDVRNQLDVPDVMKLINYKIDLK